MKAHQLFIMLVSTFTLFACSKIPIPEAKTPIVVVEEIPTIIHQKLRNYPGSVYASDLTQLSFQLNGEVVQLIARDGLKVKKGDLLAKLDSTNLLLSEKEQRARVELSKIQAGRAKKMVAQGNMPKSTYDELHAQYQMAVANHHYAEVQLGYVELRAPFDGIVSNVFIENHQATTVGQAVLSMHRLDKVEIKVNLPDSLVASIDESKVDKENAVVKVKLDAYPDHVFLTKYKEHTAEQNEESRSFTLVLEMPVDPERQTLQGMPGSVELDLAKIERDDIYAAQVPLEALVLPDEFSINQFKRIVWRLDGDKVEAVDVSIGRIVALKHVEVFGNIKPGDQIVVKGLQYLKSGMTVKVIKARELTQ